MQRSQLLVAATVALLLVVPGVAVATATDHEVTGRPGIDVSVPENEVTPGETTAISVVVLNDGNVTSGSVSNPQLEQQVTTARALKARFEESDAPVSVSTNEQAVATLPDGSSAPLQFRLTVDGDADPGRYALPLNVTYNYTASVDPQTGETNRTTTDETFDVTLVVEETPQFSVTEVDSNARTGATGTVAVTLRNTGSEPARNATVALASQNGDLTVGGAASSSRFVDGRWDPGETRTVSYRVRAAPAAGEQRYALDATVTYENSDGVTRQSRPVSLGVTPDPEQTFSVVETDHAVRVGDEGQVAVTLRNEGPTAARDATVTVQSGTSNVVFGESASTSRYVGSWAPNETRTVLVNATAVPDAETRNYSLQATVAYEDGEGDPGQSSTLGFGLRPGPERSAAFEASDVSSTLRVGEEGELTGTITNTGEERATNLVVVFETRSESVSPLEREYSVGSLDPNESATFAFDVEVAGSANPGPRQFTLRPTYRDDDDRQRQGESFDVRERVRPQRDVFDVDVANDTVPRGSTTLLEVSVTNTRDETLESVSAAMFADDPISVDDGDAFADSIGPGETRTLTFEVSADSGAITKQYPVELDFQYDEADGDTQLSGGYNVGVSVTQPADDDGDGPPLALIGGVVVLVLVGVGLYYRYGR
jgi:hypothetical protein